MDRAAGMGWQRVSGATVEELVETFQELAEVEQIVGEGASESPPPEGVDLELVATLERADLVAAAEVERAARAEPAEEDETYAVHPELYLLAGLAAYATSGDQRDGAGAELASALAT